MSGAESSPEPPFESFASNWRDALRRVRRAAVLHEPRAAAVPLAASHQFLRIAPRSSTRKRPSRHRHFGDNTLSEAPQARLPEDRSKKHTRLSTSTALALRRNCISVRAQVTFDHIRGCATEPSTTTARSSPRRSYAPRAATHLRRPRSQALCARRRCAASRRAVARPSTRT